MEPDMLFRKFSLILRLEKEKTMSSSTKGYIFAILSAMSYGTNPIFALPLYRDGMDVNAVLLMRYAIGVLIMFFMIAVHNRKSLIIGLKDIGGLAIMGVLMVLSSITLFASYDYLSAGIASTLLFFYPVMVSLIMAGLYKERLGGRKILCLIMAFMGVAILSKGDDGTGISGWGFLLVMLSSLSYALYLIYINRGPMKHLSSSAVTFYVMTIGFLVLVGNSALDGHLYLPNHSASWLNILGLGIFPTIISLWCTSRAISLIGSTQTAIFGAMEPLTAVVLGILILGEKLTMMPAIGMLLIFVSVTLLVMQRKQ